ncbi:hypothetical protein APHAL10511_000372 [Amanita phalloides]|nr:hypothetical protein APHAL10511_000372 [Amanita phalloides]
MGHNRTSNQTYSDENLPLFTPFNWSVKQIRDTIPPRLFIRDTKRGLLYVARDLSMAAFAWRAMFLADDFLMNEVVRQKWSPYVSELVRCALWHVYWWFQGLIFTGLWVIGHECGHGAFSDHELINDIIGFATHTILMTPYFSWKISHHRHHRNHASMERDEVYVPKTRADLGIADKEVYDGFDYDEMFGDTPLYTLYMLVRQQLLAFPAYLLYNVSGQKGYPKGTNHFNPNSSLFTKEQRGGVILSNVAIAIMLCILSDACSAFGATQVIKYYGIPWLMVTHWFIMITYLHHTDPVLPHYRGKEWNFQRGAAATIDRNFLGWQGRFFLHDVAHYHVIHHFFPKMPFYHGPEATQYLQAFLGEHYVRSDKPVFKALWDNYNNCQFVDNKGNIVFYRDKKGRAVRRPADQNLIRLIFTLVSLVKSDPFLSPADPLYIYVQRHVAISHFYEAKMMPINTRNVDSTPAIPKSLTEAIVFLSRPLLMFYTPSEIATVQAVLQTTLPTAYFSSREPRLFLTLSPAIQPPPPILAACVAARVRWADWIVVLGGKEVNILIEPSRAVIRYGSQGGSIKTIWQELKAYRPPQPQLRIQVPSPVSSAHVTVASAIPRAQGRTRAQELLECNDKEEADEIFALISNVTGITPTPTHRQFQLDNPSPVSSPESSRPSSRSSNFSLFSLASSTDSMTSLSSTSSTCIEKASIKPIVCRSSRSLRSDDVPEPEDADELHVHVDTSKKAVQKYLYQGGVSTVLTGGVMLGPAKKTTWVSGPGSEKPPTAFGRQRGTGTSSQRRRF